MAEADEIHEGVREGESEGAREDAGAGRSEREVAHPEPSGRVAAETSQTPNSGLLTPDPEVERLKAELERVRAQGLEAYRRALLAENAGRVIPELVGGSTEEEMERSLEVARRAFEAARVAALAEVASTPVPAGNPVRQGPSIEGMSPMQKIAFGLRRE